MKFNSLSNSSENSNRGSEIFLLSQLPILPLNKLPQGTKNFGKVNFNFIVTKRITQLPAIIEKNPADGDQTLHYIECINGERIKRKVNFGSPRTKKVAEEMGICFGDCVLRYA